VIGICRMVELHQGNCRGLEQRRDPVHALTLHGWAHGINEQEIETCRETGLRP
jgi:hypothetical protein